MNQLQESRNAVRRHVRSARRPAIWARSKEFLATLSTRSFHFPAQRSRSGTRKGSGIRGLNHHRGQHQLSNQPREKFWPTAFVVGKRRTWPLSKEAVDFVGTRKPSPYGLQIVRRISDHVMAAGVTVTCGIARGVDTAYPP
jgi:DNA recombination-mediator protein A